MNYKDISSLMFKQGEFLLNNYKNLYTNEEYANIKRLLFELVMNASEFERDIELKAYELDLLPYFGRVWLNELTNPDCLEVGSEFKLVVCHPDSINDYVISADYVTDKYREKEINYGLVCNVDESNFIMALERNKSLHLISSSSLTARFYSLVYNLDDKLLMSSDYLMGLKFPYQLDDDIEFKSNDCDFIILNRQNTIFSKVVIFEPYTEDDLKQVTNLANEYNIDIIKIPSNIRTDQKTYVKEYDKNG